MILGHIFMLLAKNRNNFFSSVKFLKLMNQNLLLQNIKKQNENSTIDFLFDASH